MVTNEQIKKAFGDTDFGEMEDPVVERREVIAKAIFKHLAGYRSGSTITHILLVLGMTKIEGGKPIKAARRWAYRQYHP